MTKLKVGVIWGQGWRGEKKKFTVLFENHQPVKERGSVTRPKRADLLGPKRRTRRTPEKTGSFAWVSGRRKAEESAKKRKRIEKDLLSEKDPVPVKEEGNPNVGKNSGGG